MDSSSFWRVNYSTGVYLRLSEFGIADASEVNFFVFQDDCTLENLKIGKQAEVLAHGIFHAPNIIALVSRKKRKFIGNFSDGEREIANLDASTMFLFLEKYRRFNMVSFCRHCLLDLESNTAPYESSTGQWSQE